MLLLFDISWLPKIARGIRSIIASDSQNHCTIKTLCHYKASIDKPQLPKSGRNNKY